MPSKASPVPGLVRRAHRALVALALLYGLAVVLVMTPLIQTHVLYAHHIDFFGYNQFDHPENYGLAPGKTVNLKLSSSDNTTLGAWFVFSNPFYATLPFPPPSPSPTPNSNSTTAPTTTRASEIPAALHHSPTILFLHGNTGTRALPLRTALYSAYTARLRANVLALDYRGFGDSAGHPTVAGVARDARAAWDFLMAAGARPQDVVIVGHSLGTAIAGLLSAELGRAGVGPRGVVLMSPFSSVRSLMDEYYLFGFLPLLKPLAMIPFAPRVVTWSLVHNFDTLTLVPDIKSSVLVVHAENDWDIQHTHSSILFNAFLEPHLPEPPSLPLHLPLPGLFSSNANTNVDTNTNASESDLDADADAGSGQKPKPKPDLDWTTNQAKHSARAARRAELVSSMSIHNFGTLDTFAAAGRTVALLKTTKGGHDVGKLEGVQDVIGRMFGLGEGLGVGVGGA